LSEVGLVVVDLHLVLVLVIGGAVGGLLRVGGLLGVIGENTEYGKR
jgi:hypothetical protein